MLKSFKSRPYTLHRTQFATHVSVNGKGIDLALFVLMTFFRAARGLANKIIQKNTPTFPMIAEARSLPRVKAIRAVSVMINEP